MLNITDLLFLLTPLGIYILIISIKGMRKFVKQKVIFEVPFQCGEGTFTISQEKRYAVYLSGKAYKKNPIANVRLNAYNCTTQESLKITPCFLRTSFTGMDGTGRIKLATFRTEPGRYTISFVGKGLAIDRAVSHVADKIIPNRDYSSFMVQIREDCSTAILFVAIWGIILGSIATISGLILPFTLR